MERTQVASLWLEAPSTSRARRGAIRLAVLGGLLLGSFGCASMEAGRRLPGAMVGDSLTPGRPASAIYGPAPIECPPGGLFQVVADQLAERAKKGEPTAKPDGRLCAVVEALAGVPGTKAPPDALTRQVALQYGIAGMSPRVNVVTFDTNDDSLMADPLLETLSSFAAAAVAPRFGLYSDLLPKTDRSAMVRTRVFLAIADDAFELDALPRALPAGGQAKLSGRLLGGAANATVLSCDPAGKLQTTAQQGTTFAADLACGERPGTLQIELRAEKGAGTIVLARFPVTCGAQPPAAIRIPQPSTAGPLEPSAQERKLFELMNAERAAAGAPALVWDDALASVARGASSNAKARAAGQSPAFDLAAQLQKAGASSALVLQNPVSAPGAEEAHALVLTSPVNRSNLLNPLVTHVGTGAVPGVDPAAGASVFFTELMVRQQPVVDTEALRGQLRTAVAQRRAAAGVGPVASDPVLEQVAQKYAAELLAAGGTLSKDREADVIAPLYRGYRSVNLVSGAKPSPLDFAEAQGVLGTASFIGVGTAQGTSATLGKNTIFVAIVVASKAPAK